MAFKFKKQVHIEPYQARNGFGTLCEWFEMHTYESDASSELALFSIHGSNMDGVDATVELWLTAEEVLAIRDGCNQILEET